MVVILGNLRGFIWIECDLCGMGIAVCSKSRMEIVSLLMCDLWNGAYLHERNSFLFPNLWDFPCITDVWKSSQYGFEV